MWSKVIACFNGSTIMTLLIITNCTGFFAKIIITKNTNRWRMSSRYKRHKSWIVLCWTKHIILVLCTMIFKCQVSLMWTFCYTQKYSKISDPNFQLLFKTNKKKLSWKYPCEMIITVTQTEGALFIFLQSVAENLLAQIRIKLST